MFALKQFSLLTAVLSVCESANILAIFPFAGPSQYILVQPYLKTLAARCHNLTVISAFPQQQNIENFHDLPVSEIREGYEATINDIMYETSLWRELNTISDYFTLVTLKVLQNAAVQELLHSSTSFDLVIVEVLQQEALYAFADHFKCPLVGISSFGTDPHIDELVGNISPISYIPMVTSNFADYSPFQQRLLNLIQLIVEYLHASLVYMPQQEDIYKQYFPHPRVDLHKLRKNFSLVLVNQHFSLGLPRPYVPNMIEVAGFHVQNHSTALPAEVASFINDAQHGVIYFSLGSNVKSKNLPPEKIEILLRVFGELKQRVMWKFEQPELKGKPDNVLVRKWFPQPAILGHPKVILFLTHGGLLSTIEAIYHAKPLVGMPVFYDQYLNMQRAKERGYGRELNIHTFTYDELKKTLLEVLENSKYTETVREMSRRFHDQPMKPLDKAIYWTEYVLRHKGAKFMRMPTQDFNFMQRHNLDTFLVLFGGPMVALLICVGGVWWVAKIFLGMKTVKSRKMKKN